MKFSVSKKDDIMINWWSSSLSESWIYRFILNRRIPYSQSLCIGSVFGEKRNYMLHIGKNIIFFSGENLHSGRFDEYRDHMLNIARVSIGFDYLDNDNYLRFPLWLTYMFSPNDTNFDIERKVRRLSQPFYRPSIIPRRKFAALIARHDHSGLRSQIISTLSPLGKITCAGSYMNNSKLLKYVYLDNKIKYLKLFLFNICPENSNHAGYVTEKIFEAIAAGCIPIYFGSNNFPEPEIINLDAVILWDSLNPSNTFEQVRDLLISKTELNSFINQPRLAPNASGKIINYFDELEAKLRSCLI